MPAWNDAGANLPDREAAIRSELNATGGSQTLSQILANGRDAGAGKITNLADPTSAQDAATKNYTDEQRAPTVNLRGQVDTTGTTDEHSTIASAISGLPSYGGQIIFPEGQIKVSSTIDCTGKQVAFRGQNGSVFGGAAKGTHFKTGTSGTAVMQKAKSGWTYITGKKNTSGTAVDQKGLGGFTKDQGTLRSL